MPCSSPHRRLFALILLVFGLPAANTLAEPVLLRESAEPLTRRIVCQVRTTGDVTVQVAREQTSSHTLAAVAEFEFRERRLPSAGRDARALRACREVLTGRMQTVISDRTTVVELPEHLRLIVAEGNREGVRSWCALGPLTRDAVDLLELPGDPLSLVALLPVTAVDVGDSWRVSDWAAQMLATIEAVESADVTCQFLALNNDVATIEVQGTVKGQRLGANSEVVISGRFTFSLASACVSGCQLTYQITAAEGVVNPAMSASVQVTMRREPATSTGRLDDALLGRLPLDPPEGADSLVFDAPPWGARFHHHRDWYVFQAILEGEPKVVILRLIERGALISQCNLSPVPAAPAGRHTPMEQFQADIQRSLGQLFAGIREQETFSTEEGGTVLRVVVDGQYVLPRVDGEGDPKVIPVMWIYYLCAAPSGAQISAVFAVEPSLIEQLGEKDLDLIRSLQFYGPAR